MSQPSYQYPHVEIDLGKLKENLAALLERCQASSIEISGVVKGFHALPAAAKVYEEVGVSSIASSRMDQLRGLKEAGIRTPLMLIRIPMPSEVEDVVTWSDISLNSECSVLRLLDEAARNQGKTHKVILMVDLGDLREGFWDWDELVAAALEVEHDLPNLELLGVGTNLGCYGSIQATPEKMHDLVAAAEQVEKAIGRKLEVISGGASSSLHMVLDGTMPPRINHLRVGEGILLGSIWGCNMDFMHKDIMVLRALSPRSSPPTRWASCRWTPLAEPVPMWTGATACAVCWPWAVWTMEKATTSSPGSRASRCWVPPPTIPFWMWREPPGG